MRQFLSMLGCGALVILQSSCGLLDTTKPDIIQPGDLDNPQGATTKYFGALANFTLAKDGFGDPNASGGTEGQVVISGWMSDELVLSTTPPSEQEVDQRQVSYQTNSTVSEFYIHLHTARNTAADAIRSLQRFSPDTTDDSRIPELWALSAFTYVYFGEDFCDGVPYSTMNGSKEVFDTSNVRDSTLSFAVARFDSALASPAIPQDVSYLALVGKARALLNLSRDSAATAAALVASVPTGFAYVTEHDLSPLQAQNAVVTYSQGGLLSVSHQEGGNGLPYHDETVRVPVDSIVDSDGNIMTGLDGSTPQFYVKKYSNAAASIPVADGIEARLIEAEAQLVASQYSAMNAILNTLRSGIGLGALPVPATQAEAEAQLFGERAYWLFATGHRLGDMRRLVRQYGYAADTVFPTGQYLKGGSYGTSVSLPIPYNSDANPRFNRSMCNPDTP